MPTKILVLLFVLLNGFSAVSQATDLELGMYELNRGEFHTAIEIFRPLVIKGYAPAQYQMATIYQHGYGVVKNGAKALALYQLAAKQNYPDALFELALIYNEGKLVPQDLNKAYQLTEAVAQKGLASAQFNLAVMLSNGTGVEQNHFIAYRWYQKAADQNHALAQYNLALLYSDGEGVEQSTEMSFIWNTIASWNNYPNANKSRILDERQLSKITKDSAMEKANRIYKKIKNQLKLKAEFTQKKHLY